MRRRYIQKHKIMLLIFWKLDFRFAFSTCLLTQQQKAKLVKKFALPFVLSFPSDLSLIKHGSCLLSKLNGQEDRHKNRRRVTL